MSLAGRNLLVIAAMEEEEAALLRVLGAAEPARPDGTIEADFRRCLDRAARKAADVLDHLLG